MKLLVMIDSSKILDDNSAVGQSLEDKVKVPSMNACMELFIDNR